MSLFKLNNSRLTQNLCCKWLDSELFGFLFCSSSSWMSLYSIIYLIMTTTCYILTLDPNKKILKQAKQRSSWLYYTLNKKLKNSEKTAVEIRKLKKEFAECFGSVKKMVVQFSSASSFFFT